MPIVRNSTLITSDCELLLLSFFVVVVILLLHWELTSEQANQIGIKRPQPHATAACGGWRAQAGLILIEIHATAQLDYTLQAF